MRPLCEPNLYDKAEALARLVEGLVDTSAATVNDDDIATIPRDQTLQKERRVLVACPHSFARDYDTYVQILAAVR